MSDEEIEKLEEQFPVVAEKAFAAARERALAAGESILEARDGMIYEVFPNGSRVAIKKIKPPTQLSSGQIFTIR